MNGGESSKLELKDKRQLKIMSHSLEVTRLDRIWYECIRQLRLVGFETEIGKMEIVWACIEE